MPFRRYLLLSLAALLFAGCGDSGPKLGEVTGQVTRGGEPLAGALVMFKAEGSPGASGFTNEAGNYALTYAGERPGAVVGTNTVTILVPSSQPESEGMDLLHTATHEVGAAAQQINFEL